MEEQKYKPLTFFKNVRKKGLISALGKDCLETIKRPMELSCSLGDYMTKNLCDAMEEYLIAVGELPERG